MDTSKLKTFAQNARRQLLEQVSARFEQVLRADSIETREKQAAIAELKQQIALHSKSAVIDRVAYTWFNRFCALRYMDANRYTRIGIVSPQEGYTQPEILQEAKQGVIYDEFKAQGQRVLDLLSGKVPSADAQGEAYRLLLVSACNAYHAQMPFLFEPIEDYTELLMPDDLLSENAVLQRMRLVLSAEACQDVEVIGWLYQFYISERKDEVFENLKKNIKIEAKDIPAATQLFTPHWIVRYLVENSLGRLWMLNHPDSKLIEQMEYYIKPAQEESDFLRISSPEEIRVCDPACGSGHMLTYAFDLLHAIYSEQGYDPVQIPALILQKNLFGIEIDERAGDLAAFALVMKARAKDRRFFSRGVEPNICVLQNVRFTQQEITDYMQVVGADLFTQDLWQTLKQFEQANNFGSLIRPALKDVGYVRDRLAEKKVFENLFLHSTNVKVQQVLRQTEYLAPRYHVVVANPPYMGGGGMNDILKEYLSDFYSDVKYDLFSAFIVRNLELAIPSGQLGFMSPFVWMFISTYEKLRHLIIDEKTITSFVQLEYSGFEGATVPICTFTLENRRDDEFSGSYIRLSDFKGATNQGPKTLEAIRNPECGWFFRAFSKEFKAIPGTPIAYWVSPKVRKTFEVAGKNLYDFTISDGQTKTGDNDKFLRQTWEVNKLSIGQNHKWRLHPKGGTFRKWYGNVDWVIDWSEPARAHYRKDKVARILPEYLWNKPGISWTLITSSSLSFRLLESGHIFNLAAPSLFFHDESFINLSLGLLNSNFIAHLLKIINPTMNMNVGEVRCLPVAEKLINSKNELCELVNSCIAIANKDWNTTEISFGFTRLPLLESSYHSSFIVMVYAALREDWKINVRRMKELEENINSVVNNSYDLDNEFSVEVKAENISLICNPDYRYGGKKCEADLEALLLADTMKEFISYCVGCMFGRYALEKPGLVLANQGETLSDYLRQVPEPTFLPDEDNVLPILAQDWFANDIAARFKQFLRATFGTEHFDENLAFIENAIGRDIRSYFLKDFYGEHLKMYKNRPIYWLFSSPGGSFNALIYLHRYQPDTVSIVLNDYLREYARKLSAQRAHLEQVSLRAGGSQAEKTRATKAINTINKVLAELKDYEDDVLYPLATRQIQIDLDDGVKVNYARFGKALKSIKGLSE